MKNNDSKFNQKPVPLIEQVSSDSYGLMDNLTLSYDGNQLTGVSEAAADYNATGTFEYKSANGSEYLYDANGNLIADRSRRIAYITYDSNNNPSSIYFTNGYMTKYTYSATGQKLAVGHFIALPNVTWAFGVKPNTSQHQAIFAGHTDYLLGGSLIVKEDKTDRLLFDGGYAKAERIGDTTYGYTLFYYNKDHLGNIREVVDAGGNLQQRTNYYPFGAPYADPNMVVNASLQPFKYNGKELDLMHGLNTYDYGARQYDPITGRWDRVDLLR
jgi:RHS repeat-associated protein